jgi:hypothetical protein
MMAVLDEGAKLAADFPCYPSAAKTGMEPTARFLPLSLTNWFSHHLPHVLGLHANTESSERLMII